jgi:hydrogenase maturation protease
MCNSPSRGRIKIYAVGNSFYGDDGVGAAVLERIREGGLLPSAELIDAGTDALALIEHFRGCVDERWLHLIIDAAKMGSAAGSVAAFSPGEVRLRIQWDHLSLHGFGLAETFAMAAGVGAMPERVRIIGVEPAVVAIDKGLSAAVAAALPKILQLINAEVEADEADHPGH